MGDVALTERDLRAVTEVVAAAEDVTTPEAFAPFVVDALPRLVSCDSASYNEVDPTIPRIVALMEPKELHWDGDLATWERWMHQHPLVTRLMQTGDGRAWRISDMISQDQFHALELYTEFYRRMRVEYQIALALPVPRPLILGLVLNREDRDFSERDRAILNLTRPHLVQIRRNAEFRASVGRSLEALTRAVEEAGQAVVIVRAEGLEFVTPGGAALLASYLGREAERPLRAWIAAQRTARAPFATPPPAEPLLVEGPEGRLVARLLPAITPGEDDVVVLEQTLTSVPGLTARQVDVLRGAAEGLTNAEIASRLGISPRTVAKHLEQAFERLGVTTRLGAVAAAFGPVGVGSPRGTG